MNRRSLSAALLLTLTALASQANAQEIMLSGPLRGGEAPDPCVRQRTAPRAPIEIALGIPGAPALGALGSSPSACRYLGFSVGGRMGLLIATSSFYGAIDAEAHLSGAVPIGDARDSWIELSFDAVRYRTVINASVVTAPIDMGAATITVNHIVASDETVSVSLFGRVLLPTELGLRYAARLGAEPGMSIVWAPHRKVSLHGALSLPITATVSAANTLFTFTPRATLDALWHPVSPFELGAGIEVRGGLDGFEYFAPRVALRAHFARVAFIDLSAMAPLFGLERQLARGALTYGMRW